MREIGREPGENERLWVEQRMNGKKESGIYKAPTVCLLLRATRAPTGEEEPEGGRGGGVLSCAPRSRAAARGSPPPRVTLRTDGPARAARAAPAAPPLRCPRPRSAFPGSPHLSGADAGRPGWGGGGWRDRGHHPRCLCKEAPRSRIGWHRARPREARGTPTSPERTPLLEEAAAPVKSVVSSPRGR